jgi:hypothetical protein
LLLGWGEHGLPGAVCATVALSHIAAAAAILGLAKFSHDSAVFLGEPGKSQGKRVQNIACHVHGKTRNVRSLNPSVISANSIPPLLASVWRLLFRKVGGTKGYFIKELEIQSARLLVGLYRLWN